MFLFISLKKRNEKKISVNNNFLQYKPNQVNIFFLDHKLLKYISLRLTVHGFSLSTF